MKTDDRVRVLSAPDNLSDTIGKEGSIVHMGPSGDTVVVQFDEPFIHRDNDSSNTCSKMWFKPEELIVLEAKPSMWIDLRPYWFKPAGIKTIEREKQAKHLGYWCTKAPKGYWNESPVDVFYVANPDTSKGHSHYFGMFIRDEVIYIANAESAFPKEGMTGLLCHDGEVIVSRYRHDFVERNGCFIDGGRDYTRSSVPASYVKVTVTDGVFHFEKVETA